MFRSPCDHVYSTGCLNTYVMVLITCDARSDQRPKVHEPNRFWHYGGHHVASKPTHRIILPVKISQLLSFFLEKIANGKR